MKHIFPFFLLILVLAFAAVLPVLAVWQTSTVTAEAVGQANLRATADVNAELVGQIVAGTRYPVIGQSQFYPWVLLGDLAAGKPMGWVYKDLVTVQGDLSNVPYSVVEVSSAALATTPTPPAPPSTPIDTAATPSAIVSTSTPPPAGAVTGLVLGEINIRYGPGVEFPRIAVAEAGERFEIIGQHTQLPWAQIRYPGAPNGVAWSPSICFRLTAI